MSEIKVGDVVECTSSVYLTDYMYRYSVVLSINKLTLNVYLGVINRAPLGSYGQDIILGQRPNWGYALFKKIEQPEKLPCYKSLMLRGHSST